MAEKTEATKAYEVLSPLKSGGKRYEPGTVVQLAANEAAKLAELQLVSAKAVKPPKADGAAPDGGEDKKEGTE